MYLSVFGNNERNQCGSAPFDVNQTDSVCATSPLASIAFCRPCSCPICRWGGDTEGFIWEGVGGREVQRILLRVPRSVVRPANAMGQIPRAQ